MTGIDGAVSRDGSGGPSGSPGEADGAGWPIAAPDGPRVAIAGGHTLEREALGWMLRAGGNFRIVGTYATAAELVAGLASDPPEVALMDVAGADGTALAGLPELCAGLPAGKIVLLADRVEGRLVRAALAHHVEGVVLKQESSFDMLAALRHIVAGHSVFPGGWQAAAAEPADGARGTRLSPRQRQVLDLLVEGLSNDEIASRLVVARNTVKFHVRTIYARLGVHNRVEAVRFVARHEEI